MKKYKVLIILIAVMAVMFAAAYVVYDTYGDLMTVQPPGLGPSGPDSSSGEDGTDDAPGKDTEGDSAGSDGSNGTGGDTPAGPDGPGSTGSTSSGQDSGDSAVKAGPDTDGDPGENGTGKKSGSQVLEDNDGYKIMVPDFTLKDLDGNEISLSDFTGKTVVLNFWATWCVYCGEELRDLKIIDKELKEAGDTVILAINAEETYDTVKEYVEKNDLDLTVLLDESGDVSVGLFGVVSFPNTFIVSSDGSLYVYIPGRIDIDTMRGLIDKARNNEPLPDTR